MMPSYVTPDRFLRQELKAQFFKKDETLEGLARQIGVDVAGLTETVRRFNQFAATGKDADFGRGDSLQDRYYAGAAAEGTNPNLGPLRGRPSTPCSCSPATSEPRVACEPMPTRAFSPAVTSRSPGCTRRGTVPPRSWADRTRARARPSGRR